MKYSYNILLFIILSCTSCKKFLEENPKGQITNANFYKTNDDAIAAINGVYAEMRFEVGNGIPAIYMVEQISDDGTMSTTATQVLERIELDNMVYNSQHSIINTVWGGFYKVIDRANYVIKYVVDTNYVRADLMYRIQAEARFIRAFYHFRLVQLFGDIPLMLEPADVTKGNLYPKRTPTRQVYESIINDLKFAEANLDTSYTYNDSKNGGRATVAAAKALLGKVYLTMAGFPLYDNSGYQLAADKLKELIDNKTTYGVDVSSSYSSIFSNVVSVKAADKERLFYTRGTSGMASGFAAFTRMKWTYVGFSQTVPSKDFATTAIESRKVYETGDLRRNTVTNAAGSSIIKYNDPNQLDSADDFIWLRYSDVLLMYAEALIELNSTFALDDALLIINDVRRKHGGPVLPPLTYVDQDDLRNKLRKERRRELAFEGHRWYDLKRWNILVSEIKNCLAFQFGRDLSFYDYVDNPYPDKAKYLPIPFQEIVQNGNLTQNQGY